MIKMEKDNIILMVEGLIREEKRICEEYCQLNPADRERREHDRDCILFGYMRVIQRLEKLRTEKSYRAKAMALFLCSEVRT